MTAKPRGVFGIRADGKIIQLGFPSPKIAEAVARDLFNEGYATIEIVDHSTGDVVAVLRSKPPTPAMP
jgi:hypothetical protein